MTAVFSCILTSLFHPLLQSASLSCGHWSKATMSTTVVWNSAETLVARVLIDPKAVVGGDSVCGTWRTIRFYPSRTFLFSFSGHLESSWLNLPTLCFLWLFFLSHTDFAWAAIFGRQRERDRFSRCRSLPMEERPDADSRHSWVWWMDGLKEGRTRKR